MKVYKFQLGDTVKINSNAKSGMPNTVGKIGTVHEQLENGSYDYEIKFDEVEYGKFKEGELNVYLGGEVVEDDSLLSHEFTLSDDLIDTFLSQYKNNDDTYTVPKQLLTILINKLYVEVN